MSQFLRRTMLMTPGNRPERLYKAVSSLADSVVFDLEDSIPPDQKNQARQIVAQTLVNLTESINRQGICLMSSSP